MIVHAAVSGNLPAAALLGWDIPELMGLVAERDNTPKPEQTKPASALAVITRQQKKDADGQETPSETSRAQPAAVGTSDTEEEGPGPFNFDDSFFPSTE